ncbi:MAG: glycoside hydrolase family 95 protein [Anaerolineae bacterium]|jgi:alpha-L-fucosidase 2|nr:glycoside hydrolase family 95 protein [Anaerolineae bacterium]
MKPRIVFDRPSGRFDEALPLGNGRLGAMVSGGLPEKHILLNEETVWYGGPRDRNNPDAIHYIGEIRELMRTGKVRAAEQLTIMALTGTPETQRHYSTLGMVVMDHFDNDGNPEDYQRVLDMETAVVTESYRINQVSYELTAFASVPDQVIAIRLRASKPVLRLSANIERGERVGNFSYGTHMDETVRCGTNGLVMRGNCGGMNGLDFRGALFGACQGNQKIIGDKLVFEKASEVTLFVAGGTNFECDDIEERCINRCEAALTKGFDTCLHDHLAEWQPLFNTASLELEYLKDIPDALPMNKVFDAFEREELSTLGPSLTWERLIDSVVLLLFQYGRYLLLSSSRNCVLPANLQGIWCRDLLPIWDGKFTTNINPQMNYWPADSANLSVCFEPYLRFAERIRENGAVTAQKMYGCRGFVLHNNTDLWADTAVQDAGTHCSYWFLGGVWIAVDLWEHYRYTRDLDFLVRAWPILRDALVFVLDFMEERDGKLVMGMTSSPENMYLSEEGHRLSFCQMSAMDAELIPLLMEDCFEAIELLHASGKEGIEIPAGFIEEIRTAQKKIVPPRIGVDGTILEWGFEAVEAYPDHRHQSHVIGAYPYNAITDRDPALFQAAKKSMEKRIHNNGANNGWSRAWAGGLMARFGEGNQARDLLGSVARYSALPNLFSVCNIRNAPKLMEDSKPLQVDGNFGVVQGVIEMLLQSHNDEIILLPALPDSWSDGSFRGLVARGNIVIDAWWKNWKLSRARLSPRVTGEVEIVTGEGYCIMGKDNSPLQDRNGRFSLQLEKDTVYMIEPS